MVYFAVPKLEINGGRLAGAIVEIWAETTKGPATCRALSKSLLDDQALRRRAMSAKAPTANKLHVAGSGTAAVR